MLGRPLRRAVALAILVAGLAVVVSQHFDRQPKTLTAGSSTVTSTGAAVDAHDGEIVNFNGTWYWYGTRYRGTVDGKSCTFKYGTIGGQWCGFVMYSSSDLIHWTFQGQMFDPFATVQGVADAYQKACNGTYSAPAMGCYDVRVVYDPNTQDYVAWANMYSKSYNNANGPGTIDTFTSPSPTGPWTQQSYITYTPNWPAGSLGAANIYIDPATGNAYGIFGVSKGTYSDKYGLIIEPLTSNYLNVPSGASEYHFSTQSVESPSMFAYDGNVYVTASAPNCAYCGGTGTEIWEAAGTTKPMSGWGSGKIVAALSCGGQPDSVFVDPANGQPWQLVDRWMGSPQGYQPSGSVYPTQADAGYLVEQLNFSSTGAPQAVGCTQGVTG